MYFKRLITTLTGILGAIFIPTLAEIPHIFHGKNMFIISPNDILTLFLGVLILSLLTGVIQKNEQVLFVLVILLVIGSPIFILTKFSIFFEVNIILLLIINVMSIIFTGNWIEQMIQDNKI